jgi:hypothetical protein
MGPVTFFLSREISKINILGGSDSPNKFQPFLSFLLEICLYNIAEKNVYLKLLFYCKAKRNSTAPGHPFW